MNDVKQRGKKITGHCARCGKEITRLASTVVGTMYCDRNCFKRPIEERFWEKVDKSGGPDACWPFTGCIRGGYGAFPCILFGKSEAIASRVAYILTYGPINEGDNVLHKCPGKHNPRCCNPSHLKTGDQEENVDDAMKQGTQKWPIGEQCHKSDMTPEKVKIIRQRMAVAPKGAWKAGGYVDQLAAEIGTSRYSIFDIYKRRSWKHVP